MCTDEFWFRRTPTQTVKIAPPLAVTTKLPTHNPINRGFWLTPTWVPKTLNDYYFRWPDNTKLRGNVNPVPF